LRIGITGHQDLGDRTAETWVRDCIRRILEPVTRPVGLSSLAVGADQIFAEVILSLGGNLVAVIPFPGYETRLTHGRNTYDFMLAQAREVIHLQPSSSDEESYFAAGKWIVDHSDRMIGVWNGLPAKGLGGTADIVQYATDVGREITLVNPIGRTVVDIAPARNGEDL